MVGHSEAGVRYEALLPAIFMFLIAMASIIMIRLGLQAHSRAGTRIAMAGFLTMGAYLLKMGTDYREFLKFRFPWW